MLDQIRERSFSVKAVPLFSNGWFRRFIPRAVPTRLDCGLVSTAAICKVSFLVRCSTFGVSQRKRLTFAKSTISSPRPLRTAFIMKRLKPFACSKVIVGGIESS